MNRLSNEDAWVFWSQIQKQWRAISHHWNKLFVTNPCGIEQNVITEMADLVNYLTGVVNSSVISTELNNGKSKRSLSICFFRNFFRQPAFLSKLRQSIFHQYRQ